MFLFAFRSYANKLRALSYALIRRYMRRYAGVITTITQADKLLGMGRELQV